MKNHKRIAILGGGPSGLFMFKKLLETRQSKLTIDIFEKKKLLGAGMPYSEAGANTEHITNVSGNEIPELVTTIAEWIQTVPQRVLEHFGVNREKFNDYKVLPRLLFGQYLSAQFSLLQLQANRAGVQTNIYLGCEVTDVIDYPKEEKVVVEVDKKSSYTYERVIICTGHHWPVRHEGKVPGYFDSPYPPAKLAMKINHPVAIKGASLTAIDAIRTLARHNGSFNLNKHDKLVYTLGKESVNFKLLMHSRAGMLPAVRFHLEDSHLMKNSVLSQEAINVNRAENEGFLLLDFVFEQNFKQLFLKKDPEFYLQIRDMRIEEFVEAMMKFREKIAPFQLFKSEYSQADKSIKRKESVYWKEMLAVLSFAMNYPAKYLSAEDMQRLQKVLMPLISKVIAFVPQSSVEEMLALHEAGVLDVVAVGEDSRAEPDSRGGVVYYYTDEEKQARALHYQVFVDCVGQPHLSYEEFPYQGLLNHKTISPARLKFRDAKAGLAAMEQNEGKVETDGQGNYWLKVPGITINDHFQVIDEFGALNERIYIMAVPFIGGYNPDYSGLDFCEAASVAISKRIVQH
jgi:uncharacterized NAD(P)/FAD-binding protein YdhS